MSSPADSAPRRIPRGLKITCGILLVFALLVLGLHLLLGYLAAQNWREAESQLKASGETLDFMALVPKPVPDADNFFAVEPLKDIAWIMDNDEEKGAPAQRRQRLEGLKLAHTSDQPKISISSDYGTPWNAPLWADYLRRSKVLPMPADSGSPGRDILASLAASDALFRELGSGLNRPHAFITPHWRDRELPPRLMAVRNPHLSGVMTLAKASVLRAQAAVAAGETQHAVDTLRILLRLAEGQGHEPMILNSLVSLVLCGQTVDPLWSLLQSRQATEAQLAALQRDLDRQSTRDIVLKGLRGELAAMADWADWLGRHNGDDWVSEVLSPNSSLVSARHPRTKWDEMKLQALCRLNPRAIGLGNKASIVTWFLDYQIEPMKKQGFKGQQKGYARVVAGLGSGTLGGSAFEVLAAEVLPASGTVGGKASKVQTRLDQARLACALERYYLQHHQYPAALSALVPGFLAAVPLDVIDGQPMRYARTPAGRYRLWSLGTDADDDGGKVIPSPTDTPDAPKVNASDYPGDWVWSYEPLVPANP